MGLPIWAEQQVRVIEPGTRTVNGSPIEDWENLESDITYEYCWAYPAATVEDVAARDAHMVGYYVLLPENVTPTVRAKIYLEDGLDYQIQGKPKQQPSITGFLSHTAAYVERWEG